MCNRTFSDEVLDSTGHPHYPHAIIFGQIFMAASNGGNLGFEDSLFKAADKLRGSMEPS